MELRDFAERILFADRLEDKLARPDEITDANPGTAMEAPEVPGRPPSLRFKASRSGKSSFPGVHALENPTQRGRLLHFFANHELLAVELMALVLLRFPEAPATFRRGVLRTLRDEQEHTRLYLQRMSSCGVAFGELPVSGYFWRAVSGMVSPIDYVSGLSLTFEQANLDFARHFALGFRAAGDLETADLLDRIYRDEIAHVAYGLKWFRRWKSRGESDWDAFCRCLRFPLSPQRAKGPVFNAEGRSAAGFDAEFIQSLDVYSMSKGRTPSVFVFNPFAEGFIASGPGFTPRRHAAALARELAHLPMFLGRRDDVVVVPSPPRPEFLHQLQQNGFPLPEFIPSTSEGLAALALRKLGHLRPWAWAPDSVRAFAPLTHATRLDAVPVEQRFHPGVAVLYSKAWSADFLRNLLRALPPDDLAFVNGDEVIGRVVSNDAEALEVIGLLRARYPRIVAKEPLGLAGGNALRLWEPELLDSQKRWMRDRFARGETLIVEPWLDRLLDFSVQLEASARGVEVRGYTGLLNDVRGQYVANWAEPDHASHPPSRVAEFLRTPTTPHDLPARIQKLFESIARALEGPLSAAGFSGPLGIDAFVYRALDGGARLKPIVEINPRTTFGRLTLELMRHVLPGRYGLFRIVNRASLRSGGHAHLSAYAEALTSANPLQRRGSPVPRIDSGAVCLSDPEIAESCLATFEVGKTRPEIQVPDGTAIP